ncbi:MAG: DUF4440 domain-containing protein [Gemmatimonadetes bacterium]|nr:DUF4440 domain-containing protein [Gemmatimonadota bacterium]
MSSRPRAAGARIRRSLGGVALVLCAACGRAAPGIGDEIPALEERLRAAMMAADTAALAALWAPEYSSTSAVGHSTTRAEGLMAHGAGLVRVDTAALREVTVRQRGDSAVSTGILEAGSAGAGPFGSTVRFRASLGAAGGTVAAGDEPAQPAALGAAPAAIPAPRSRRESPAPVLP